MQKWNYLQTLVPEAPETKYIKEAMGEEGKRRRGRMEELRRRGREGVGTEKELGGREMKGG